MTIYYARTIGTNNTRARQLGSMTLQTAKAEAEARYGDGFTDDEILIEREGAGSMFVIVASKRCGSKRWDNLDLNQA